MEKAEARAVEPEPVTEAGLRQLPSPPLSAVAAAVAFLAGGLGLAGWIWNIALLKSIQPEWVAIKPNAAVALLLLSVALLPGSWRLPPLALRLARVCGLLAGLIGVLTLGEYLTGSDFGIDQWLFQEPAGAAGTSHRGRPAPDAAVCLVMVAVALELRSGTKRKLFAAAVLGGLTLAVSAVALISYSALLPGPSGWWALTLMAAPAALALALAGGAITLTAWREAGPRWALHGGITAAFVCGLMLLVFVGLISSRRMVRLAEMSRQFGDEQRTLMALTLADGRASRAQSEFRAYLLTGDETYLQSYLQEMQRFRKDLATLLRSLPKNPRRWRQLSELDAQAGSALQWWQQTLEISRAGDRASASARSTAGTALARNIQPLIQLLETDVVETIQGQQGGAENVSKFTNAAVLAGTLAGLIALVWVLMSLNRTARVRQRYEQKLQNRLMVEKGLGQLAITLLEPRPSNGKLQLICEAIVELLGTDFCRIWLTHPGDRCELGCPHAAVKEGPRACLNHEQCLHLCASAGRYTHLEGGAHSRMPIDLHHTGLASGGAQAKFLSNDLLQDPHLLDAAWARDLGLVSFAGYRLQSPVGAPMGVLALFARKPILKHEDLLLEGLTNTASLVLLAGAAEDEARREIAERKRAEEALRRSRALLIETEEIGKVGGWEFNSESGRQLWTDEVFRIFEVDVGSLPTFLESTEFFSPESKPVITEAIKRAVEHGEPFDLELDVVTAKGNRRNIHTIGKPIPDGGGVRGFIQDITARRQSEEQIRASEIRYRRFMESQIIGIIIADTTGVIREANDLFLNMLGYSRAEFDASRLRWDTLTAPAGAAADAHAVEELKSAGFAAPWEKEFLHRDGRHVPVLIGAAGFETEADVVTSVCFVLDLTGPKRAEAELRETQAILRIAMDQSPAGVVVADATDGKIRYANNAAILVHGADPGLLAHGEDIDEYVARWPVYDLDGRQLRNDEAPLALAIRSGEQCCREIVVRRPGGEDRVVSVYAAPILDDSGVVTGAVAVFPDITEHVRAEAKTAASERRLKRAEVVAHIGHWILDVLAGDVDWSDEMYHIHGVQAAAFRPDFLTPLPLCHPADQKELDRAIAKILDGAETRFEYRIVRPDGTERHVTCFAEVECDAAGHVRTVFGALQDTTEVRQKSRELQQKSAELERFTYTISHDLKSPLVTVKTFLGYLVQDLASGDAARIEKDFHYIRTAAERMGRLLDELLQMSRIGRVNNPPVRSLFEELVEETLALVAGRIAQTGVAVHVTGEGVILVGDRPRLVEIWQNLLENALKFMGGQEVPIIQVGVEARGLETVFFVRDNGIGIDPRYTARVFELFEKLDGATEGTGLGLALVKRIVETYKGRIWCESPGVGLGSCFYFTLPAALQPEKSENP